MSDPANYDELLRGVAAMANAEGRGAAARELARQAGAEDLIIFVRDPPIGRSLPAPGFQQTLRGGRVWRELIERAVADGTAEAVVPSSEGRGESRGESNGAADTMARAFGLADGTVLVLLRITRPDADLTHLRVLLPLFGALFRMESLVRNIEAEAVLARQSAAQSAELAAKLDVTRAELQRALTVAETATHARDEFLATISHELRTPLTSIIGWIQLLRDEREPGVLAEGLGTIDRNARAQSRLIEDILDFSRINAGKLRLDVRAVDLGDVVGAAIEVVRPAADAKGLNINSVLDPNAGLVSGDPDRLQQVVWNLLSNAVKFTSRGGKVQIRLERVNSHTELTVSDTGEGIAPEFLPFVFDRFSQADSTSTRLHGGLGLGLGIVQHLVELHGGTVQVFSPGVGHGATFAVKLPLIIAHSHTSQPALQRSPPLPDSQAEREQLEDLTGLNVLIVEDHDDARKLLTTIMSRCGASVRSAASVQAAIRLLDESHPDIIVSDIEMPGEDGYSLIRKIRLRESPFRRIPAIALTAYARGIDRVRALAAGFQMHIAKPVEPAELVAAVKSLAGATSRGKT